MKERGRDGRRTGGVIWHTQGREIVDDGDVGKLLGTGSGDKNPRIVLVTDRVDSMTTVQYLPPGIKTWQAKTGEHLLQLVKDEKSDYHGDR